MKCSCNKNNKDDALLIKYEGEGSSTVWNEMERSSSVRNFGETKAILFVLQQMDHQSHGESDKSPVYSSSQHSLE